MNCSVHTCLTRLQGTCPSCTLKDGWQRAISVISNTPSPLLYPILDSWWFVLIPSSSSSFCRCPQSGSRSGTHWWHSSSDERGWWWSSTITTIAHDKWETTSCALLWTSPTTREGRRTTPVQHYYRHLNFNYSTCNLLVKLHVWVDECKYPRRRTSIHTRFIIIWCCSSSIPFWIHAKYLRNKCQPSHQQL